MKTLSACYWIIHLPYQQNRILAETPKTPSHWYTTAHELATVLINITLYCRQSSSELRTIFSRWHNQRDVSWDCWGFPKAEPFLVFVLNPGEIVHLWEIFWVFVLSFLRGWEMAQQIKVLPDRSDDPSSIPSTLLDGKRELTPIGCPLTSTPASWLVPHTYTNKQ